MLGPAWPSIRSRFDQPLGALGILVALSTVGSFVASAPSGYVRARVGASAYLVAGTAALAAAVAAFALSPSWWGLLAASLVLGAGAATLDAGFNAHVALRHGPRMMNVLHASYGAGATLGPAVVAAAIAFGSWRSSFGAVAAFLAAIVLVLWITRASWPTAAPDDAAGTVRGRLPGRWTLPAALGLFFVATGVEVAIGNWSYTLLVDARGFGTGGAAAWVSVYWALFTVGRILLGLGGGRITPARVVTIGSALTVAGCGLLWWNAFGAGVAGLALAGAGLSGVFPSLVTLTPVRLGVDRAAAAIGYQIAAGTAGSAVLTAAAGVAAQRFGLESLGPFLLAAAASMLALDTVARRA